MGITINIFLLKLSKIKKNRLRVLKYRNVTEKVKESYILEKKKTQRICD